MKYTPRTWKYGDQIKPQDMNSIENAIKETDSCIYAVGTYQENDSMFIDKTYNEIKEAAESGLCVMLYKHEDGVVPNYTTCAMLREYFVYDGAYYVIFHEPQDGIDQGTSFRSLDPNTSMLSLQNVPK